MSKGGQENGGSTKTKNPVGNFSIVSDAVLFLLAQCIYHKVERNHTIPKKTICFMKILLESCILVF